MASLDRTFGLLSKARRRRVLYYLDQQAGPVTVDELTRHVAERETETTASSIRDEQIARIHTGLYHADLPKLAEAGVVRYDSEAESVELAELSAEFRALMEFAWDIDNPPHDE